MLIKIEYRLLTREGKQWHNKEGNCQQNEEEEAHWQDATPISQRVVCASGELSRKAALKIAG